MQHSETANIIGGLVIKGSEKLSMIILNFDYIDVYNIYASSLFYHLSQNKTIFSVSLKRYKKIKSFICVLLICRWTGQKML